MTDSSPLTPEQDAVRRLLAETRHDGPTPPEVVARLDASLASLVSERGGSPLPDDAHDETRGTGAAVVDLGSRRRRRAGVGLLAAAAVVVAGVALGQTLPRTSGGDAGTSAASDGAGSATSETPGEGSAGGADAGSSATEMAPEARKGSSPVPLAGYPTLSSTDAGLDDDLLDLRVDDTQSSPELGPAEALSGCDLRGIGQGRRLVAQVDGQVGVVVFRRPDGAAQQADLYICGSSVPVRTLTLPAP